MNKNKGSKKAQRTAARLAAVQAVYQMVGSQQNAAAVIRDLRSRPPGDGLEPGTILVTPDEALLSSIVSGIEARKQDIDALVTGAQKSRNGGESAENGAAGGSVKGASELLLRCILMCGAYELLAHHDTDAPVIISDYLDVTHAFYDQGESKLVNAVLDNIRKGVRDGV